MILDWQLRTRFDDAYSKHAEVTVPSLDDWEKQWKKNPQGMEKPKVVAVDFQVHERGAHRLGVVSEAETLPLQGIRPSRPTRLQNQPPEAPFRPGLSEGVDVADRA